MEVLLMADVKPVITVIGCGYVGLTLAAVLAGADYTVYAVEIDPKRLGVIKEGRSFFYEEGADPLIAAVLKSGKLIPTDSYEESVPKSDIVFCCVGTPDNPDGSSNLTYVFDAASKALTLMKDGTIFAQKSTVPVGTSAKLQALFAESGKHIPYVSCPEFSREATAIWDTLWFDRVVAGSDDEAAAQQVLDLHRTIQQKQAEIGKTAGLTPPATLPDSQYIVVSRNSAELIKVTANAFLALKISFANSIAKLADKADADITDVMDGIGSDKRIGRAFLNAGRGYGGGCFPKDVSGLIRTAEEYGVEMEIMNAATEINASMPRYIIRKAKAALGDNGGDNVLQGKTVAVLGLAFKAGTSDVRKSPAIVIANTLAEQGATVKAYDPEAMDEAKPNLDKAITLVGSVTEAIKDAEVVFIATDWSEIKNTDLASLTKSSDRTILVDCINCLDPAKVKAAGLTYIGIGRA
jgi:UDPglucose 6-dehydrogenase